MDFGGFILFGLLAFGLVVGSLRLVVLFMRRSPVRWRDFRRCLGGVVILVLFGRYLYQVYWLDEQLFIAAAQGSAARVEALLSAGASPDATWEDGRSAIEEARRSGHKDVVAILENAGAH
jgi:uncharacterized protein